MVGRRVSLFFTDGMSEQRLALVPGPTQHVLAAGSGKSSLLEMGVLQDTPKVSLGLLQRCLISVMCPLLQPQICQWQS